MQEGDGICHLFYGIQGLYWTTAASDLNYAADVDSFDIDAILGQGKIHFLEYGWDGGVRGWMGWNWCRGWDLKLIYTYYRNDEKSKTEKHDEDIDLFATLVHPESFEQIAEAASGKLHLEYQTIDAIFGKVLTFCSNTFVFHPFFGARGLKLDRRINIRYEGGDFEPEGRVKWSSSIKAAGLHAGVDMQMRWRSSWGIFGGLGGSLLAGSSENEHRQYILGDDDEEEEVEEEEEDGSGLQIDLEEDFCTCLPGLNVSAGVSWDCCFCECLFMKMKLGYEFNRWFNTPQIRRYHSGNKGISSDGASGQLCLHGATLSFEIYF
jgi:hypothetical protein